MSTRFPQPAFSATVHTAFIEGAKAWMLYGCFETAFLLLAPVVAALRAAITGHRIAGVVDPAGIHLFSAFAIVIYALIGGLCGAAAAAVALRTHFTRQLLADSDVDAPTFWSGVGSLTLVIGFGIHAYVADQAAIAAAVPLGLLLSTARIRSAARPAWRRELSTAADPLTVAAIVLLGALVGVRGGGWFAPAAIPCLMPIVMLVDGRPRDRHRNLNTLLSTLPRLFGSLA